MNKLARTQAARNGVRSFVVAKYVPQELVIGSDGHGRYQNRALSLFGRLMVKGGHVQAQPKPPEKPRRGRKPQVKGVAL